MSKRNKKSPVKLWDPSKARTTVSGYGQIAPPTAPVVYTIQVDAKMLRLCQLVSSNPMFQKDIDKLMKKYYT